MDPAVAYERFRAAALAYPETYEESPWGDRVVKVRRKVFVFLGLREGRFAATTKLPRSQHLALSLPFTAPCGYGLGKSGWVTSSFPAGEDVPLELLLEWLDESYRTIAPKRLVRTLDAEAPPAPQKAAQQKTAKKAPKKTARAKRPALLLVGEDPLRLERAERALREEGFRRIERCGHEGLGGYRRRRFGLILFDLGRRSVSGMELAAELAERGTRGAKLGLCGVRAEHVQRARDAVPEAAGLWRRAPGDPRVVQGLCELLSG